MEKYKRFSPNSGLTDSDVIEMLILAEMGKVESFTELARSFGVDRRTVSRIINGQSWSHVPRPRPLGKNYFVCADGRVFSKTAGKFLSPKRDKDGNLVVELRVDGKRERAVISHLVAKAFIGKKPKAIRFNDGDPSNPHLTNISVVR